MSTTVTEPSRWRSLRREVRAMTLDDSLPLRYRRRYNFCCWVVNIQCAKKAIP
ncbi:hypothetical protein [Nostoc favosum]|uniref:Uncharacterized protein n=1 Tax=Nostoc favosum CHAB5714 TaxID=2780399 RepID=A0ABS8I5Y3_9NOSO|nr:hypothetical protein [Nostoc favosum]MCC5598957.1 hypothetical protein [Nostoc favosum CHAB5714]